jgi:hypothetical protein
LSRTEAAVADAAASAQGSGNDFAFAGPADVSFAIGSFSSGTARPTPARGASRIAD